MEFKDKLYDLRKQKGMSQEELALRLNVSRQTVSKWELGDSTPDMEKLVTISNLFEISLDELVMDKVASNDDSNKSNLVKNILTDENKKKIIHGLKIAAVILGIMVIIDIISMIVYFSLYGFPQ